MLIFLAMFLVLFVFTALFGLVKSTGVREWSEVTTTVFPILTNCSSETALSGIGCPCRLIGQRCNDFGTFEKSQDVTLKSAKAKKNAP